MYTGGQVKRYSSPFSRCFSLKTAFLKWIFEADPVGVQIRAVSHFNGLEEIFNPLSTEGGSNLTPPLKNGFFNSRFFHVFIRYLEKNLISLLKQSISFIWYVFCDFWSCISLIMTKCQNIVKIA